MKTADNVRNQSFLSMISHVIGCFLIKNAYLCTVTKNNRGMAETIIGRRQEQALLERYYNSGKAEFIALYGRRRIGKTFLIRQYFRNQFSFDMTGVLEGNKNEQITYYRMRWSCAGGNQKMLPEQRGIYRDYDCKQNQVKM